MSTALAKRPAQPAQRGRAGTGRAGRPLNVRANFFTLDWQTPKVVYHYDVDIQPEPKGNTIFRNREIIERLQSQVAPDVFQSRASYDGRKNLYSSQRYELPGTPFQINMTGHPGPFQYGTRGHYVVSLRLVSAYQPQAVKKYVAGGHTPSAAELGEVLQLINCLGVILRQAALANASAVTAKSIFTEDGSRAIQMGLTLMKGYFQSVRPAKNRLLLNMDVTTGIQWTPRPLMQTVLDYVNDMPQSRGSQYPPNDLRRLNSLPDSIIFQLNRAMKGLKIRPKHRANAMPKMMLRFDKRGSNQIKLPESGRSITQYFQQDHNITLQYPNAPCVWMSATAALPIELCIIEKQMYRRLPPPNIMREVLAFSKRSPEERMREIRAGLTVMQYATSEFVQRAGLRVGTEPLSVQARVLAGLTVQYLNGTIKANAGAWNLKDVKFIEGAVLRAWGIVDLRGRRPPRDTISDLRTGLTNTMVNLGMNVLDKNPPIRVIQNLGQMETELDRFCQELVQNANKGVAPNAQLKTPHLLVCVIDGSGDIYTRVKHWGDVFRGVTTQCLRAEKIVRLNDQYLSNVAMKCAMSINLKRGGFNHVPVSPMMNWLTAQPTIIFGADTSHPAPGETGKPSISSIACSVDLKGTKYITDVRVQRGRQEIIEDLPQMIWNGIRQFLIYQTTKEKKPFNYPTRLIFYRDGVSEGQFQEVCESEVRAIDDAWNILLNHPMMANKAKPPRPAVTFVVVGKRHHVRFFPERKDADRSGNAPAGLVVDTDIVHPYDWDFYLQAHAGLLGTSRPMHATILVDENHLTEDQIEELTFALTHNYPRATRSVSIPSPVYHAHLAGGRAKIHYDSGFNSDAGTAAGSQDLTLNDYKQAFKPVHANLSSFMYWM